MFRGLDFRIHGTLAASTGVPLSCTTISGERPLSGFIGYPSRESDGGSTGLAQIVVVEPCAGHDSHSFMLGAQKVKSIMLDTDILASVAKKMMTSKPLNWRWAGGAANNHLKLKVVNVPKDGG